MKPTFKLFIGYCITLLLILVLATSCNPVKQVLKDRDKFEQVAKEVVKSGYCINDTITISKDSIIYSTRDSLIHDTVTTKCPDFDKTLPSGIRVMSKNGLLSVNIPVKIPEKQTTRTITNNIRDKKLEDILRTERDAALDKLVKSNSDLKTTQTELKEAKRKNITTWIIVGIILVGGLVLKFKKYIPFI